MTGDFSCLKQEQPSWSDCALNHCCSTVCLPTMWRRKTRLFMWTSDRFLLIRIIVLPGIWESNLQQFYKMSSSARMLPTGRQVLFYSEEWCWEKNIVFTAEKPFPWPCLPVSSPRAVSLHFFLCLTSTSAATSVWWSTLLRWMNLIHVTPSFISLQNTPCVCGRLEMLSCHLG